MGSDKEDMQTKVSLRLMRSYTVERFFLKALNYC